MKIKLSMPMHVYYSDKPALLWQVRSNRIQYRKGGETHEGQEQNKSGHEWLPARDLMSAQDVV